MSIIIMTNVWDLEIPSREKLVLLAIADAAKDHGRCWTLISSLAKKCSMEPRAVQRAIKSLIEMGHLERKPQLGRSNEWIVKPHLLVKKKKEKYLRTDLQDSYEWGVTGDTDPMSLVTPTPVTGDTHNRNRTIN